MGFPKEIYQKAAAILAQRRQAAREEADRRRQQVYQQLPQLPGIERELARTGMGAVQAVAGAPDQLEQVLARLRDKSLALQQQRDQLLRDAGLYDAYHTIPWTCPLCQDTGYQGSRRCRCLEQLLRETAFRQLGADGQEDCRFENFSLDYYSTSPLPPSQRVPREQMAAILDTCLHYAHTFSPQSPSLLFLGGTGLGKTHLSLAIAREVIAKGYGVVYSPAQNLLARLERERFSSDRFSDGDDPDATSYQNLILTCDLLIVDDLGTEFLTQFSNSMIYNIINTRLIEGRPTIISTNLDLMEIGRRYSERLVSRLFGGYQRLDFLGQDVRILRQMRASGTPSSR